MKEVFGKIKAFYIQKKKLAVGVTVAVLGLLAAVGVYAMIPEVKAAQGDDKSDPIPLTSGGKHQVEGGKWYKITGGFTDTYTLEYTGDGASVNLILENINWNIGQDKPAIEFTGQSVQRDDANQGLQNMTYTSGSSSRSVFNVIISGKNSITSTCAAKNPLISAESLVYNVKTYGYQRNYGQNNELEARVVRDCEVEFTGNGSADDVLILTTGTGSTGAAIGSADVSGLDDKIVLDSNTALRVTGYVSLSGDYTDSNGILYKNHQEVVAGDIKYGAGSIQIEHNANIVINGRGNGAGIGTGASSEETVTYKRSDYSNPRGTITAKNILDGDKVEINGGSVSIHMADNAMGCCIGIGAVAGQPVKQGSVQIKGGNVDLVPASNGYEFGEARNGNTLVYKFRLDLSTPPFSAAKQYQLEDLEGERFDVFADYTGEENADRSGILHFTVDAAIANAGMTDKISDYEFIGYAKAYFEQPNRTTNMYFYLPTKTLTPYKLEITSDSPEVGYFYTIGTASEQQYNGPVSVKETKEVKIRLTNVSKYCKSITYTISSRSGTSTETVTADENWNGSISFNMPSNDCTVSFQYEIPKYTIEYDYGAGKQYESSIKNENARECSFGIDYELKDISWQNHIFMGWYSTPDFEGEPITKVETPSEEYIQTGRKITVYAKWGCEVSFVDENGELLTNLIDRDGNEFTNPLILEMSPNAVLYPTDYPQDLEDTSLRAFDGWLIDGELYEKPDEENEYPQKTFYENTVIQAKFHDIGYYVYIYTEYEEPNFGNIINVEPSQVGNFATYYNYISGEQSQPIEFEYYDTEDGKYYRTKEFISGEDIGKCLVTCSIKAKKGYSIAESGIHVYNAKTKEEIELSKSEKDEQAYQFTMPDSDVYVKVNFEEGNYEVVYYDVNEDDEVIPAILDETYGEPVTDYNARSEQFKLVPAKQTDKYKKFVGWCKIGETEVIKDNLVIPQEHLENLYLYAKWEDVVTYPIIVSEEASEYITVYDTDRGLPVDKGIPGEELKIVVDVPRGVRYNTMTWYYTDINNSDCTLVHTPAPDEKSPYTYDFIMPPASPVRIEGEFSWIEYHITYLNLNGAVNPNPITYTVKDKIDLEALEKKGIDFKGWNIVLPDEDNYIGDEHFATKEEPIETINGEEMSGNIILVAHWDPENETGNTLYKILIDNGLMHGTMDSYATEAYGGQYVFFSAIPDRGYKLKNVSYSDSEPQVYSAEKALRAIEGILNTEFDIPLYEVADGIYYFIMPEHDVNLVAEFEPIEYTITYVDGNAEDNPAVYTIEDEIWLTAPSKEGFEFLGWYDEGDNLVSSIIESTGNLVLTAKWKNLNPQPVTPPEEPNTPDTPDTPDNPQTNPPTNQPQGGNTNSNSNSSIDKLLSWINNNSKVDSSEDKAASNNKNQGNGSQLSTGDKANIGHFALLCVLSLIIIIIACPKRKEEEEME